MSDPECNRPPIAAPTPHARRWTHRLAALLAAAFGCGTLPATAGADPRCLNLVDPELALPAGAAALQHPILFVTQLPLAADLQTRYTTFGNHLGQTSAAGRGGDLWLLHPPTTELPEGCLRNLTREAGFGESGEWQVGEAPIAVREPVVHWSGERALFAMVRGAPAGVGNPRFYWQLFEARGLGLDNTLQVERVDGQPVDYNNVSPVYAADDDRIYFSSDQPRNGPDARHLYPQQDEYERDEVVSGLWQLRRSTAEVSLLTQNPSGVFSPMVDSAGRLIVSRWDHLQRDIFAERAFQFASEAPDAPQVPFIEHFPEPLPSTTPAPLHPDYGREVGYRFKHFFLWELRGDGSGEEVLNHLGRHELVHYFDPSLQRAGNGLVPHSNPRPRVETVENMLHPEEDPQRAHRYYFVDAPHFQKQSSGRLLYLDAEPGESPDLLRLVPLTSPQAIFPGAADYDGDRFRDPLPLAAGGLLASHANPCGGDPACNDDTADLDPDAERFAPNYRFRLHWLRQLDDDPYLELAEAVTPLISRRLRMYGVRQGGAILFDGPLSQLDAVELRPRPRPPQTVAAPLPAPELQVFAEEGVDPQRFQDDLRQRDLALMVVRDVTTRDRHDRQQPFNLQVHGSAHGSLTGSGQVFTVSDLQLFQADLVSGYEYRAGRRPQAMPLHAIAADTNPPRGGVPSELAVSLRPISPVDGSVAALVPARRALTWQLNDAEGTALVRERYWISFQPGELRVCTSCHGPNVDDQLGRLPPEHPPEALRDLLRWWKQQDSRLMADGFEG